jgi:hypothetical protein
MTLRFLLVLELLSSSLAFLFTKFVIKNKRKKSIW